MGKNIVQLYKSLHYEAPKSEMKDEDQAKAFTSEDGVVSDKKSKRRITDIYDYYVGDFSSVINQYNTWAKGTKTLADRVNTFQPGKQSNATKRVNVPAQKEYKVDAPTIAGYLDPMVTTGYQEDYQGMLNDIDASSKEASELLSKFTSNRATLEKQYGTEMIAEIISGLEEQTKNYKSWRQTVDGKYIGFLQNEKSSLITQRDSDSNKETMERLEEIYDTDISQLSIYERGMVEQYKAGKEGGFSPIRNDFNDFIAEIDSELTEANNAYLKNYEGYRDASLWDVTGVAAEKGFKTTKSAREDWKNKTTTISDLEEEERYKFVPSNEFEQLLADAFGLGGQVVSNFTSPEALVSGIAGAGYGVVKTLAPDLLPGAWDDALGVLKYAGKGLSTGAAIAGGQTEAGFAYNELIEQGIDPERAYTIATVVGGINAGLEKLQMDELISAFKVGTKLGADSSILSKIANVLKERGVDVLKETGQELLQEGVTIAGTQYANLLENGTPAYTGEEVKGRLFDTAVSSLGSFGLTNLASVAVSPVTNSVSHAISQKIADYSDFSKAFKAEKVDTSSLIQTGLNSASANTRNLAQRLQEKQGNGQNISMREWYGLYRENISEARSQAKQFEKEAKNYVRNKKFLAEKPLKELGRLGQEYLVDTYSIGQDPVQYAEEYVRIYSQSKEGVEFEQITSDLHVLSEDQAEIAYRTAQYDQQNLAKSGGVVYNETNNIEGVGGDVERTLSSGPRADGSSGWPNGLGSVGRSGSVQSGTRSSQAGRTAARLRAEEIRTAVYAQRGAEVSTRSFGLSDGTDTKNLRVVPETLYTEEMKRVVREQAAKGRRVTFVVGAMEFVDQNGSFNARGAISSDGKNIWIRADHDSLSVEAIAKHEEFHAVKKKSPAIVERLRQQIIKQYDAAELDAIIDSYVKAYGWTKMAEANVLEEIFADAYAGIDIFTGRDVVNKRATAYTDDVTQAVREAEQNPDTPSERSDSGTKYSIEVIDGRVMTVIDVGNNTSTFELAEKYLKTLVNSEKPFATILSEAQEVYVGKDLPGEYKSSEDTKRLYKDLKKVKMQAATNLDEMLLLAEHGEWQENKKEKHEIDAKYGWYRYNVEFAVPIMNVKREIDHYTTYEATLLIRNDADGKSYLYDMVNLEKKKTVISTSSTEQIQSEVDASSTKPIRSDAPETMSSTDSISETAEKSQEEFYGNEESEANFSRELSSKKGGGKTSFSRDYWRPKLNKSEWTLLNRRMDVEIGNEKNYLDENTKWLYSSKNGVMVFAIYGIGDGTDATPLYASRGKRAEREYKKFFKFIRRAENGINEGRNNLGGWVNLFSLDQGEHGVSVYDDGHRGKTVGADRLSADARESNERGNHGGSAQDSRDISAGRRGRDGRGVSEFSDEVKLSREIPESREYGGSGIRWAVENDILTERERSRFFTMIADIKKRNHKVPRTKDGKYVVDLGNKLAFTDGDWHDPSVDRVIVLLDDDGTRLAQAKGWICNELSESGRYDLACQAVEKMFGEWYVYEELRGDYRFDEWENERGEGNNRQGTLSEDSSGRNQSGKVKFSRDIPESSLVKENEHLRERMEYWKGQTKKTKEPTLRADDIRKLTRDTLRSYDSKADFSSVNADIKALGEFILRDGDGHADLSWEVVKQRAVEIARKIVEDAERITNPEDAERYRELYWFVKGTKLTLAEQDQADIPDFNEFRQKNFGKLTLARDGEFVDAFYPQLTEKFGEGLFPSSITHPADQLMRIVSVVDDLKPAYGNPYQNNVDEVVEFCANDIIDDLLGPETRQQKTIADKYEAKLTAEKAKAKQRLAELREEKRKGILRTRIKHHTSELSKKLLRPTDNKHIPQDLRTTVAQALASINTGSEYTYDANGKRRKGGTGAPTKSTENWKRLRREYMAIAKEGKTTVDGNLLGDSDTPGWLEEMEELSSIPISALSEEELQKVWNTIRALEASISSYNRNFAIEQFKETSELANAIRADNAHKKRRSQYTDGVEGVKNLVQVDMLTPETYFHFLGDGGDAVFRAMRNAQDEHIRILKETSDFANDVVGTFDVVDSETAVKTITLGGKKVQISTAQLMELYSLARRPQAYTHIVTGGIRLTAIDGKGFKKIENEPIMGITQDELTKAFVELSDTEIHLAEELQRYLSTTMAEKGNEASLKVFGYQKFQDQNYWPIRVPSAEKHKTVETDTTTPSLGNRGFTLQTVENAKQAIVLSGIFDTFADHVSEMAEYAAWLGVMEDVNHLRNFKFRDDSGIQIDSIADIIRKVHGTKGNGYLAKLLEDITNGVSSSRSDLPTVDKMLSNYKAASVGFNLRVVIQQPTAILRALDMIDAKYLAIGMKPSKGFEKAKKYAPIAQWKDWGYFEAHTGRQVKEIFFGTNAIGKMREASMSWAGKADSLSWGMLWNACEAETKAKRKDLKEADFYQVVAKRFTEIVDHTQVVDGTLQRSHVMRNNDGISKSATAFMSEPTKQYNMAISAAYDVISAKDAETRKNAKQRLARTVTALVVSAVANVLVKSLYDPLRDDDKEKDYWEKVVSAMVGATEEEGVWNKWVSFWNGNLGEAANPFGYVPVVKDLVSVISGYDVKRMDMEALSGFLNAAGGVVKALNGDGKYNVTGAFANLFFQTATLLGVPVSNLKREVKAIVSTTAIVTDNYRLQYWLERSSKSITYYGNTKAYMDILYAAYESGSGDYQYIYNDLVQDGFDPDKIRDNMESRLKKSQGVTKVADLEQRFLSPNEQASYDSKLSKIKSSAVWSKANSEQRKELESDLYDLTVENNAGARALEIIEAGSEYGLTELDYLLYQLALEVVDGPNASGKYGTYTNAEKRKAARMVEGASAKERNFLLDPSRYMD